MNAARSRLETSLLAGLTLGATALAAALLARGLTTPLEAVGFATGALCVWLTVRESVWNFPIGMANVAVLLVVFVRVRLYADAGLQVLYFALGAIGWYLWLFGGAGRRPLRVTGTPARGRIATGVAVALMWAALVALLRATGGSSPLWDGLTTALSLAAQWLTDRKRWECWLLWITVDVIYVPLYASKGLYLTATLFAVFLVMACVGLRRWRAAMRVETIA